MVLTTELSTLKLSDKLAEAPELEPISALSTEASSDSSSSTYSFEKERKHERYIRARDRVVFCLNVINLVVSCALITKGPNYYVYWNAFIVPALMLHRLFDYFQKGWHFYMIDFCYLVNLMVIVSTIFFPKNEMMFMISYALSMGPLVFAIFYFRGSLAFTSMDKITSLSIHCQAPLTMFLVRWFDNSGNFLAHSNGFGFAFLSKWYGSIILFYGIWALVYCSTIFGFFGGHITRRKLQTMYSYTMADPRTAKKLLSRGARWSKMIFMFHHFRGVMALATVSIAFFYSYWLGLIWLLGFLLLGTYNGATYSIDYQGTKYERQFAWKSKRL